MEYQVFSHGRFLSRALQALVSAWRLLPSSQCLTRLQIRSCCTKVLPIQRFLPKRRPGTRLRADLWPDPHKLVLWNVPSGSFLRTYALRTGEPGCS